MECVKLVPHFQAGTRHHVIRTLTAPEDAALRARWNGTASAAQDALLLDLGNKMATDALWIACECLGERASPPLITVFRRGDNQDRMGFRRMTAGGRPAHKPSCPYFVDAVEEKDTEEARTEGEGAMPRPESPPPFPSVIAAASRISESAGANEPRARDSNGETGGRLGGFLRWMVDKAGWQSGILKAGAELSDAMQKLRDAADGVEVMPGLPLRNVLFTTLRAWESKWFEQAARRMHHQQALGLLILLAGRVDAASRTIEVSAGKALPVVKLQVEQKIAVYGGQGEGARAPFVVICLLALDEAGAQRIVRAYAHPVYRFGRPVLVDSDLERKTLDDLLSAAQWLQATKRLVVTVDKPVFDVATGLRPDFVVRQGSRSLWIETMGSDQPGYRERKSRVHEAMRRNTDLMLDERANPAVKSEIGRQVIKWALAARRRT
jgi:hypothetical protein